MKSKETRLLTLSGQTAPAATDPHSQRVFFFSFASSASFTQTLQTSFSRSLLTSSRQSEMLSAPPPLSLSQPTFNPNLKTQLRSALSPSANVHRATRHTVSCRLATSSVRTSCSPAPWQPPTISGFISPQGFNTLEAHASRVSDLEYWWSPPTPAPSVSRMPTLLLQPVLPLGW